MAVIRPLPLLFSVPVEMLTRARSTFLVALLCEVLALATLRTVRSEAPTVEYPTVERRMKRRLLARD